MKIKLADVIINIEALHDEVYRLCAAYQVQGDDDAKAASFDVIMNQPDIDTEKKQLTPDERLQYTDAYLETLAVYRKIAEKLLEYDTVLFHGSAIAIDGKGYIIAAPSGTGKSTLARNIAAEIGSRMTYINDDKPLIAVRNGRAMVYGTPWDGKHHLSNNISVPLAGIIILERAGKAWIRQVAATEILQEILQQTYRPDDTLLLAQTLGIIDNICTPLNCYRVGATIDASAARLVVETIGEENKSDETANSTTLTTSSIEEELKNNGWIIYTNVGSSMEPLIVQGRDLMVIESRKHIAATDSKTKPLQADDVVLFKREGSTNLVLHRILKVHGSQTGDPGKLRYDIIGDNQYYIERGVRDDQIIGILTKVIKDANTPAKREISPDDSGYYRPRSERKILQQRIVHCLHRSLNK